MIEEPAHWRHLPAQFGDRVRIRQSAETEAAGVAGRTGVVYGITTVSISGVQVLGTPTDDTALNVALEESEQTIWLAPRLIDFVDHSPGTNITVTGVAKQWTRDGFGNWIESSRRMSVNEWPAYLRRLFRRWFRT